MDEPQFVGYRRERNPLQHGSIQRLQALGKFRNEIGEKLILSLFMLAFIEAGLEPLASSGALLLLVVMGLAVIGIYRSVASATASFCQAMGRRAWVSVLVGLFLPALLIELFMFFRGTVILYALPPTLLLVLGLLSIDKANRELVKYGVGLSKWPFQRCGDQISRALAERRHWEANPLPPVPTELFSGEPPQQ